MDETWRLAQFEVWRDTAHEGYKVSSLGNIRGKRKNGKNLKPSLGSGNVAYLSTTGKDNVKIHKTYASIVALAFIGPHPGKGYIVHIDRDPLNNRADNLAYGATYKRTDVRHHSLTDEQVEFIKNFPQSTGSQSFLAKALDISEGMISRVINGK